MQIEERLNFDVAAEMSSPYGADRLMQGITIGDEIVAMYGPYIQLQAGRWSVAVSGTIDQPEGCRVEAVSCVGRLVLGEAQWTNGTTQFDIHPRFAAEQFEIRVLARPGCHVRITNVSVSRSSAATSRRSFEEYHRLGLRLLLDHTSMVDGTIINTGSWEMDRVDHLRNSAFQLAAGAGDMVFLDIGAYFGLYSMVMAHTNLFERVIAFEADRLNYRQLTANLLLNDPGCFIETQATAVSDQAGETIFASSLDHYDGNRGGVGIAAFGTPVMMDRIDSLVPLEDKKIIAKIDVEGHELQVLRGMTATLQANRMLLQIETFSLEKELDDFLKPLGYRRVHQIGVDYYYSNFDRAEKPKPALSRLFGLGQK